MENLAEGQKTYWKDVKKFTVKIQNGINHRFTFLTAPGLEPTSNRAERALREHVIQKKIVGTPQPERHIHT